MDLNLNFEGFQSYFLNILNYICSFDFSNIFNTNWATGLWTTFSSVLSPVINALLTKLGELNIF